MKRYLRMAADLFGRPYKLCDILTFSRILFFTPLIVALTAAGARALWVFIAFTLGELTDAFDGPASRKWPYPEDAERRLLRRRHKGTVDKTADVALGVAVLFYVALRTYQPFGWILLVGVLAIGVVSQILVVFVLPPPTENKYVRFFVLFRRDFLYGPAIGATITTLLLKMTIQGPLTWDKILHSAPFLILFAIGLISAAMVYLLKKNRTGEP